MSSFVENLNISNISMGKLKVVKLMYVRFIVDNDYTYYTYVYKKDGLGKNAFKVMHRFKDDQIICPLCHERTKIGTECRAFKQAKDGELAKRLLQDPSIRIKSLLEGII